MPKKSEETDLSGFTFEQLVEQLDVLSDQMASPTVGIEAVSGLFVEAGRVKAEAERRLAKVRDQVEQLTASADLGES